MHAVFPSLVTTRYLCLSLTFHFHSQSFVLQHFSNLGYKICFSKTYSKIGLCKPILVDSFFFGRTRHTVHQWIMHEGLTAVIKCRPLKYSQEKYHVYKIKYPTRRYISIHWIQFRLPLPKHAFV
jgi:hypothetical protein